MPSLPATRTTYRALTQRCPSSGPDSHGQAAQPEIWTVSEGTDYTGKPRPAVIIQGDHFDTDSVTLCPFTTDPTDAPLFRLLIEPDQGSGLDGPNRIMADKVTTVRRSRLGTRVGVLDDASVLRLNRALVVFLGIAGSA
jgi:mRNA interferase MazF